MQKTFNPKKGPAMPKTYKPKSGKVPSHYNQTKKK